MNSNLPVIGKNVALTRQPPDLMLFLCIEKYENWRVVSFVWNMTTFPNRECGSHFFDVNVLPLSVPSFTLN